MNSNRAICSSYMKLRRGRRHRRPRMHPYRYDCRSWPSAQSVLPFIVDVLGRDSASIVYRYIDVQDLTWGSSNNNECKISSAHRQSATYLCFGQYESIRLRRINQSNELFAIGTVGFCDADDSDDDDGRDDEHIPFQSRSTGLTFHGTENKNSFTGLTVHGTEIKNTQQWKTLDFRADLERCQMSVVVDGLCDTMNFTVSYPCNLRIDDQRLFVRHLSGSGNSTLKIEEC